MTERPCGPGDLGDDRGHPRLVPADAGVEDGHAGLLEQARELDDLVPRLAALDQVEQRDPVHDREALAHRLAGAAHDLDGEAHPVGRRPTPPVGAVVGARGQELVDQVALGAHDLDAVVARLLRQSGGVGEVRDGPVDALGRQRPRAEGRDRRPGGRGADGERVVAVAAGVQDLHRDRAARLVHRAGHPLVPDRLQPRGHLGGEGLEPAALVGRVAAGHDQPGAAAGALGEVRRQLVDVPRVVLEAGVHRAHDHPVAQGQVAEGDRLEEVGVGRHRSASSWVVSVRACASR